VFFFILLFACFAGGRVELEQIGFEEGFYYYRLRPIPITHDFLGDSNVFAFVFDIEGFAGQEEVDLIIRNNLPYVSPAIGDFEIEEGEDFELILSEYENDVEDSGDDLRWEVVDYSSDFLSVELDGKTLFVEGDDDGLGFVVLRLYDLDGDYDEVSFEVEVKDDGDCGDSCSSDWDCSGWSQCDGGIQTRICVDLKDCDGEIAPEEFRPCSSSEGFPANFTEGFVFSSGKKSCEGFFCDPYELIIIISLAIMILAILILIVYFLIR
jgi:hypothetical protein